MRLHRGYTKDADGNPVRALLSDNVPHVVEEPEHRTRIGGAIVVGQSGVRWMPSRAVAAEQKRRQRAAA